MGAAISYVWDWWGGSASSNKVILGPDADVPHPVTGVTPRQRFAVQDTWDLVKPNLKTHGVEFFIMLFDEHPELQTRFKGFGKKTREQLKTNSRLAAHGSTVLLAITGLVDNLGDVPCLVELLKTTGKNHVTRGVPKHDFDLLAVVLVKYLRLNLGSAWNDVAEGGWTQVLKTVNSVIFSAYDNPEESD